MSSFTTCRASLKWLCLLVVYVILWEIWVLYFKVNTSKVIAMWVKGQKTATTTRFFETSHSVTFTPNMSVLTHMLKENNMSTQLTQSTRRRRVYRMYDGNMVVTPGQELPTYDHLYRNHKDFPRMLTLKQHAENIRLLRAVSELFDKNNVSYIMAYGTLLGAYLFHDIIPWDDDLDLLADMGDINKLRALFRTQEFRSVFGVRSFHEVQNIDLYSDENLKTNIPSDNISYCGAKYKNLKCYHMFKIYFNASPHAGKYPWRYPFIDVLFTYTKGDQVITLAKHIRIKFNLEKYYPLTRRPYYDLWLPAPKNTKLYLKTLFKKFFCQYGNWNHAKETGQKKTSAKCDSLRETYPHVKRKPIADFFGNVAKGYVMEDLLLGDRVLHTVLLNESYNTPDVMELK